MDTQVWLIVALIVWISVGPVLSVIMGRRGHSPAAWGTAGLLLGPLALPVAVDALWQRRRTAERVLAEAPAGRGPISVLAGIDGSEEAVTALTRAVAILGDRIGRLSLVYVASIDATADPVLLELDEASARQWMASACQRVPGWLADERVVAGRPAETLARLAAEDGYDLVVVGTRGRGISSRVFGSVARSLATSAPVPVLIGGQGPALDRAAHPHPWTLSEVKA